MPAVDNHCNHRITAIIFTNPNINDIGINVFYQCGKIAWYTIAIIIITINILLCTWSILLSETCKNL